MTPSVVDMLQQLAEYTSIFQRLTKLGGLPPKAIATAAAPLLLRMNEQVVSYCRLLQTEWPRGESFLPGAADGRAVWCATASGKMRNMPPAAVAASRGGGVGDASGGHGGGGAATGRKKRGLFSSLMGHATGHAPSQAGGPRRGKAGAEGRRAAALADHLDEPKAEAVLSGGGKGAKGTKPADELEGTLSARAAVGGKAEQLAAVRLQAAWRGKNARDVAPHPPAVLCLMLNNLSWCQANLRVLERGNLGVLSSALVQSAVAHGRPLAGARHGTPPLPSASCDTDLVADGVLSEGRRACVAAGLELIRYIVRRRVYGRLQLARAHHHGLSEFLREVNETAAIIATWVNPPWRAPLLLALFGTLLRTLEMADTEPERLESLIVTEAPVVVLAMSDVPQLEASLQSDDVRLHPAVLHALRPGIEADPLDDEARALQEATLRSLEGHAPSRSRANSAAARRPRGGWHDALSQLHRLTSSKAGSERAGSERRRGAGRKSRLMHGLNHTSVLARQIVRRFEREEAEGVQCAGCVVGCERLRAAAASLFRAGAGARDAPPSAAPAAEQIQSARLLSGKL